MNPFRWFSPEYGLQRKSDTFFENNSQGLYIQDNIHIGERLTRGGPRHTISFPWTPHAERALPQRASQITNKYLLGGKK